MPTVHFAGRSVECPHGANLRMVLLRARLPLYTAVARALQRFSVHFTNLGLVIDHHDHHNQNIDAPGVGFSRGILPHFPRLCPGIRSMRGFS